MVSSGLKENKVTGKLLFFVIAVTILRLIPVFLIFTDRYLIPERLISVNLIQISGTVGPIDRRRVTIGQRPVMPP